jgi:hypothetical protein
MIREVISQGSKTNVEELLSLPFKAGKIKYYQSGTAGYRTVSFYMDDDKLCISDRHTQVYMGTKSLYTKSKDSLGFTFDFKTKKVKNWFGKYLMIDNNMVKTISKHYRDIEWACDNMSLSLISFKPALFAKVLTGKITNPRDLIKHYLKYHVKVNVSPELLYQAYAQKNLQYNEVIDILHKLKYLKNLDHALIDYRNSNLRDFVTAIFGAEKSSISYDALHLAKMLDYKVDHTWSQNRLKEEHDKWTKEVMQIELESLKDEVLDYPKEVLLQDANFKFSIVNSKKDLFQIGKHEHHCIYTNYWNRIKDKEYFCLHGYYNDKNYTIGIQKAWNSDDYVIDQIQSKYNGGAPDELKEFMYETMKHHVMQDYFKKIAKKQPIMVPKLW